MSTVSTRDADCGQLAVALALAAGRGDRASPCRSQTRTPKHGDKRPRLTLRAQPTSAWRQPASCSPPSSSAAPTISRSTTARRSSGNGATTRARSPPSTASLTKRARARSSAGSSSSTSSAARAVQDLLPPETAQTSRSRPRRATMSRFSPGARDVRPVVSVSDSSANDRLTPRDRHRRTRRTGAFRSS